jgi:hypothetical protein
VHVKFVKIIGCEKCDRSTCSQLLRDSWENDPQAGYVGTNYERTGRGSGRSQACPAGSPRKTGHIRQRSEPYETTRRHRTMPSRMTSWADLYPTGRSTDATFPLAECGLTLGDITYFNLVRCRTIHNGPPNAALTNSCRTHFHSWLNLLEPSVVTFMGKWVYENGKAACERGMFLALS